MRPYPSVGKMKHRISCLLFSVGLSAVLMLCGCGSGSSAPPIFVSLSPSLAQTIDQGETVNITATVANDSSGKGVTWSLNGPGSLSNQTSTTVTYNGISVTSGQTAMIVGSSVVDATKSASLTVSVNPLPQITTLNSLPNGATGSAYAQTLNEFGGTPPFKWSIMLGGLPRGLNLNSGSGTVSGIPSGGGTWYFAPQLTDATGATANSNVIDQVLSLTVLSTVSPGNSIPFIYQPLIPTTASPGGPGFTLTVNGTGFVSGAIVEFNGVALPTSFISNKQLTATVPASDIVATGTASITAVNPAPGGGHSNIVFFPIARPETSTNFSSAPGSPVPDGPSSSVDPVSVAIADFNADGKPDLAVAAIPDLVNGSVSIFLGNGDGSFNQAVGSPIMVPNPPFALDFVPRPLSLLVGDFNDSGNAGLAVLDSANQNVAILFGKGDGTFTASTASAYTQASASPATLAVGDFTGDGNLDLAVTNLADPSFAFLTGFGDGAFNYLSAPPPSVGSPNSVAIGDFDGDGKLDLAYGSCCVNGLSSNLVILLGNGDGTFRQAAGSPLTVASTPRSIVVGDFNGDGKLDLAYTSCCVNGVGQLVVLLGNGDGTFFNASGSPISVGVAPESIAVGDFTGNGKLDLTVAIAPLNGNTAGSVEILLGNGDGTFTMDVGSPITVGRGPTSLAVGDFNGSGRLGLAIANGIDSTITILVQH